MATATQQLLDLVKRAQGGITDYRVSKLMGVSDSSASLWRTGKSNMSAESVAKACELAGIAADTFYWNIKVAAERETGAIRELSAKILTEIETSRRTGEVPAQGVLNTLLHGIAGKAAAILAAAVVGLLMTVYPNKQAVAAEVSADSSLSTAFIMRTCILRPAGRPAAGTGWRRV